MRIDLNADLGEGVGDDDAVLDLVTSASLACGGHRGDAVTMRRAARAAHDRGVVIGAHPSYVDPDGFGRRRLDVPSAVLREQLLRQVRDLAEAADVVGARVRYLKAHGALYNAATTDDTLAALLVEVAATALDDPLPVLGLPASRVADHARQVGVTFVREGFADRATRPDGTLVPREEPGAVLTEPGAVAARVPELLGRIDTICLHGDTPDALALARAARTALADAGAQLAPFVPRAPGTAT